MSVGILELNHVSLIISDVEKSRKFYCDVIGFVVNDTRPELAFPGLWLDVNGMPKVHLLQLPNPDSEERPEHGGRDRHAAFNIESLDKLVKRLEKAGIEFSRSRSGRKALFCRDPDHNALEFIES